jgi:hypothetical protein
MSTLGPENLKITTKNVKSEKRTINAMNDSANYNFKTDVNKFKTLKK